MFDWAAKSTFFTSSKNDSGNSHGKRGTSQMEIKGFMACFVLLNAFPTFVITTSSSQQIICNTTQICSGENAQNSSRFGSNFTDCCRNSSPATSATYSITENSSDPSKTNTLSNGSPSRGLCSSDSICNSRVEKCLSLTCVIRSQSSDKASNCSCISLACGDGRCYNLTAFRVATTVLPTTTSPAPGGITKLQLMLLFGSMGGIFIFIIVVYCVKTFTDNRQRQYLLKHGVWDTPREDQLKESTEEVEKDYKSDASQMDQSKMEVPTITVEMENELSKSKSSQIEVVKEEETEDFEEANEELVRPKIGPKIQPDIIQVRGYTPIPPAPNESPFHENANVTRSTKEPSSETTKPRNTIETPTITNDHNKPSSWNKDLAKTPLTESPKRSRFPGLKKTKDPPKRIIANGTPEKSPKLNSKNRTAPPPQLVEPENFSDFGM